jgi:hypothetical protein
MTQGELQHYLEHLATAYPLDNIYIPRRFTALPESGSLSDDVGYRSYRFLRESEPALEEILTHPRIAIVADPCGGKSMVARAAMQKLIVAGDRVPVFAEVKQYRGDLATLFRISAPAAILNPAETADGQPLRRTYILDGIDEIPAELLESLGRELREFIAQEPEAHFICTARQAFYVANRQVLPPIPAVFHILALADEEIEQYATRAGVDHDRFMEAIHAVNALEEVRNPFVLSVMVRRFQGAGSLSPLRSENLSYMIDSLIHSRPELNAHRQRRALRMLGVAMETYSRNERIACSACRLRRRRSRNWWDSFKVREYGQRKSLTLCVGSPPILPTEGIRK